MKFRIDRRNVALLAVMALVATRTLFAQPARRVYRIATLDDTVEGVRDHLWRAFRNRLRELVLAEGNDVAYEARYARAATERLPALAAELVALKPDVLVVVSTPGAQAAIRSTSSLPIVFVGIGDPVGAGLIASLARPGANATGTSVTSTDFAGKWLELLLEIAPGARQLAFLTDVSTKPSMLVYEKLRKLGAEKNATIHLLDARRRTELEHSFEAIRKVRIQGIIVSIAANLLENRDQIVQFAARSRLPVVYARREYVDAGGLLSYGADIKSAYTRGAEQVHRILKGAKPADLPVEQMSSVKTVLNLKTARALGIKIPESVRTRVDEVIE
jgi:putative tryptophan/tyrosine transport system substrate-binding protein